MSYLEWSITSRSEYDSSANQRVKEAEFVPDTVYTGMYAFEPNTEGIEAAKLPTKINDVRRTKTGLFIATVGILDPDLNEMVTCRGTFNFGYWIDAQHTDELGKPVVIGAYLKEYRGPVDDELDELAATLSLSSQELVRS